jgi:hypothetical protein
VEQWAQIKRGYQAILDEDLAALNAILSDARVPHVASL